MVLGSIERGMRILRIISYNDSSCDAIRDLLQFHVMIRTKKKYGERIFSVINFRVTELVKVRVSWSGHPVTKKEAFFC